MADVFLSYSRTDRDRARQVASTLEAEGFTVWWDAVLRTGETYDQVTEKNLREAGAVVVLWSKRSVDSNWVRAEATVGERSSALVPVLLEPCDRPVRFELVQTADLSHWRGARDDPHWQAFVHDVRAAIARTKGAKESPATATASADPHPATIETTFWNSIKDGADRFEFEAYLERFPNGHFAALARNRLAALDRAKPVVAAPAVAIPPALARQEAATPPRQAKAPPAPPPPQKSKSNAGLIAGLGIALGLAVVVGSVVMLTRGAKPAAEAPRAAEVAPEPAIETPPADTVAAIEPQPPEPPAVSETPAEQPAEPPAAPSAEFRDCDDCPLMKRLDGGAFEMGSPLSEPGRNGYEGPQREVRVAAFAIGLHEVTVGQWNACVAGGGCAAKGPIEAADPNLPARAVSYTDAKAYVSWLSTKSNRAYRLPTEAEWEFAARGGSPAAYWWGDRYDRNAASTDESKTVGSGPANPFGLFDVAGGVREWVADCYLNTYESAPTDGSAVTAGDCSRRVIRGGSWSSAPADMRIANRSRIGVDLRPRYMGFRVAAPTTP